MIISPLFHSSIDLTLYFHVTNLNLKRALAWLSHFELSNATPPKTYRQLHEHLVSQTNPHTLTTNTMADRGGGVGGGPRGGFGSRGDRGGDRGRGRGRGRGRRGGPKSDEKEWQPVTKLGRLVKAGKIKSMEEIYLHSLPIKEYQIVDFFLPKLKDEVMKVRLPLQSGFAGDDDNEGVC